MKTDNTVIKHTPTPWQIREYFSDPIPIIAGFDQGDLYNVCEMSSEDFFEPEVLRANAEFIVKACNSYDSNQKRIKELEDALELVLGETDWMTPNDNIAKAKFDKAKAILKKP